MATSRKNSSVKSSNAEKIVNVRKFAKQCDYDPVHCEQVRALAEMLFAGLVKIHGLGPHEKFLLTVAAILHDIGWSQGKKAHHKNAMRKILEDNTMPLTSAERNMIAATARYHRKALPKSEHPVYGELAEDQQKTVQLLAGILRIADGLDRSQIGVVESVDVCIEKGTADFKCTARSDAAAELWAAQKKADLFEKAYALKTRFSRNC